MIDYCDFPVSGLPHDMTGRFFRLSSPGACEAPTRLSTEPPKSKGVVRICVLSDTHCCHESLSLPKGDILLLCGDCFNGCSHCSRKDRKLPPFFKWLNDQPFAVKVFIGGNHDNVLEAQDKEWIREAAAPAIYLLNESVFILPFGIRIYGSPWSLPNSRWSPNSAFLSSALYKQKPATLPTDDPSGEHPAVKYGATDCDRITAYVEARCGGPIDILMTHQGMQEGNPSQNRKLARFIAAKQPRLFHCGGHVHKGRGLYWLARESESQTTEGEHAMVSTSESLPRFLSINAAIKKVGLQCGLNPPLVVDVSRNDILQGNEYS